MLKSFIFCQAPMHIQGVLACYEHEINRGNEVLIITKNSESMFHFFKSLKLNAEIVHLAPVIKGSILRHWLYVKRRIKADIKNIGITGNDSQVFFTSICDDDTMGIYLSQIKCPIIRIMGVYNAEEIEFVRKGISLKNRIKENLFSWIFNYKFQYILRDHWALTIDIHRICYPKIDCSDLTVYDRYKVNLSQENEHCVIFFTEPYRNTFQTEENYMYLNKLVIRTLQEKGYKVGVKGHPRIGLPQGVLEIADFEIQAYIPAEFINFTDYDFAIGFVSTSICGASMQIDAYSILPMCEITDKVQADFWYEYLQIMGKGKVHLLYDFNELPYANH